MRNRPAPIAIDLSNPKANKKWLDAFIENEGAIPAFGWTSRKYMRRVAQTVCLTFLDIEGTHATSNIQWTALERLAAICFGIQVCKSLSDALEVEPGPSISIFLEEFFNRFLLNSNVVHAEQRARLVQMAMTIISTERRIDLDMIDSISWQLFCRLEDESDSDVFSRWKLSLLFNHAVFISENSKVLISHGLLGI